jgi:2-phospho-L-lactate guanylyltransferase (CobY/MobA/RfbA family)
MLLDTVETIVASGGFDVIEVLTPEPEVWGSVLPSEARTVEATAPGLNESLSSRIRGLARGNVDSLSIVMPDLPSASEDDFVELSEAVGLRGSAVIVPDRHFAGTNVLAGLLPFPWNLSFGEDSLNKHLGAIIDHGLSPLMLCRSGLMCDVDDLDDLMELYERGSLRDRTKEFVGDLIMREGLEP